MNKLPHLWTSRSNFLTVSILLECNKVPRKSPLIVLSHTVTCWQKSFVSIWKRFPPFSGCFHLRLVPVKFDKPIYPKNAMVTLVLLLPYAAPPRKVGSGRCDPRAEYANRDKKVFSSYVRPTNAERQATVFFVLEVTLWSIVKPKWHHELPKSSR